MFYLIFFKDILLHNLKDLTMKCAQTPLKICQVANVVRLLSTSSYCHKKIRPSLPNLATSSEATKKTELKRRLFGRMFDFIENYGEKVLSNVLPIVAMKAVKMFSRGTKLLFQDMKEFVWINRELSETAHWQVVCRALSRRQLEVSTHRLKKIYCFNFVKHIFYATDLFVLAW